MFDFHKDHKSLVNVALIGFVVLSLGIAVLPAYQMQDVQPLPKQAELSNDELKGLSIYVAEGCVGCHTQQVRSIEMDKTWGDRPSLASDYYYSKKRMDIWRQSPSLLGSERTGPDLTNVGKRQPGQSWHLLHLYNPRTVIRQSIMPGYPWLFEAKDTTKITKEDVVVPVSASFFRQPGKKVIATKQALQLVAYLQALKQTPLPDQTKPKFIPSTRKKGSKGTEEAVKQLDGKKLFQANCAACHQKNGKGLKGAFPPLAGSPIVNDDDFGLMIRIILQGYDARTEYGQMAGFAGRLSNEEIAAIANHERNSWGNKAAKVSAADVKKIRDYLENIK